MPRVTRGTKGRRRRNRILSKAKGFVGGRKLYRAGRETIEKGLTYAYRDRKVRKREFRQLWIVRINAAARAEGLTYGTLIHGLKQAGVEVDRKMLAEMAVNEQAAFVELVNLAKSKLAA
ncbi:MAG: large subunit ribosomal protein L20 [Hyphomicrobiaceae bacterium]|jgi:large subunit ribosomal protein L20